MKHWKPIKLSEVSKKKDAIVSGPFGSNLKVSDYKSEGVPILRLQNIGDGYFMNKDIKYISEEKAEELKYHSFRAGDIALAKLGIPIGKTCIIPESFSHGIIVADVVRIRPDSEVVDYKFLEYYLNSDLSVKQLTGNISGATRPRVNLSDVRNIELNLPSLPEQQQIVSTLDQAFDAIDQAKANLERNIENAKELFQSKLNDIFSQKGDGWEEKRLGDLVDFKHGYAFKSKFFSKKGNYVLLTPGNYYESGGYRDRGDKQKYYEGEIPDGFILSKNDLLLAMTEQAPGLLGSPLIVPYSGTFLHNQRLGLVKQRDGIELEVEFLFHLFNTRGFRKSVYESGSGVKVRHTSPKKLSDITVNVNLNQAIQASVITELKHVHVASCQLVSLYENKLASLEELKKSILQQAFSGELTKDFEIEEELAMAAEPEGEYVRTHDSND